MKPVIISFPRSGRTWLTALIGLNICHYKGLPIEQAMVERKKVVAATHDKTDKSLKIHAKDLSTDKSAYSDTDVIFMKREPKDILVSAYLHATKRKSNFKGTLSEYIRDPRFGIEKILRFYQIWEDNDYIPDMFFTITYECLLANTTAVLTDVCIWLDTPYTPLSIKLAVRDGHIDNLREKEASGFFVEGIGKPKHPEDIDTYYHRKGGSGGYVDYMTKEDIAYCEGFIYG